MEPITPGNVYKYAVRNHKKVITITPDEIGKDLGSLQTLSKYFYKVKVNNLVKDRQILNILIVFLNVFDYQPAIRLLFFYIKEDYYPYLKTFLTHLDMCPEEVKAVPYDININSIEIDDTILKRLQTSMI